MQTEFESEQLSFDEHERRCRQLTVEGEKQKQLLETYENALRREESALEQLRQEVRDYLEQVVEILLPDLSDTTRKQVSEIFPNQTDLPESRHVENERDASFWTKISDSVSEFFGYGEERAREQQRILLRQKLWQLREMPSASGRFEKNFQVLFDGKAKLAAQEYLFQQHEAQTIRQTQNLEALNRQIENCLQMLNERKNSFDRDAANQLPDYESRYNSAADAPPVDDSPLITNIVNETSSTSENISSAEDFSFGGGGDFAGGGAGGSWENYS